jgi:hypothetical protein
MRSRISAVFWSALVYLAVAPMIFGPGWIGAMAAPAPPIHATASVAKGVCAAAICVDPVYVDADATRIQRGIEGYVLSNPAGQMIHTTVISETRAATLDFEVDETDGSWTTTVNVTDSDETLVVAGEIGSGSITVNDRTIATWEDLGGGQWDFANFDNLSAFTSWNIYDDVLRDENFVGEVPVVAAAWLLPAIALIVAVFALVVSVTIARNATLASVAAHNAACATAGHNCADAGYNPTDPACVYWYNNCPNAGVYGDWCDSLLDDCNNNQNQNSCDLYNTHCP